MHLLHKVLLQHEVGHCFRLTVTVMHMLSSLCAVGLELVHGTASALDC